ncbi:hypothetical protein KGP36_06075 [Patescibacteria group bacterium]|nr:hypothetical protein [Patescibacteria group bacterium]
MSKSNLIALAVLIASIIGGGLKLWQSLDNRMDGLKDEILVLQQTSKEHGKAIERLFARTDKR